MLFGEKAYLRTVFSKLTKKPKASLRWMHRTAVRKEFAIPEILLHKVKVSSDYRVFIQNCKYYPNKLQ
tara:strand:+ start:113299 stop:113502 length:204 start_codon:yes stop_codon:yes gene_type:complete